VTVRQFQFMPAELVVEAGTTVTWANQDQILHTATSGATPGQADGTFDGPMDGAGKSFSFTFEKPGTYPYFCSRHNSMVGKVIVR
jgi:plastocyanin